MRVQKSRHSWELPGGPVVRTWRFHSHGLGSIPGWGNKIPKEAWHSQKKNQDILTKRIPLYNQYPQTKKQDSTTPQVSSSCSLQS